MARPPGNPNWRPGVSGNPGGKPKVRQTVAHWLKLELTELDGAEETGYQRLARKLIKMALAGNLEAAKLVLLYSDGRPPVQVNVDAKNVVLIKHESATDDGLAEMKRERLKLAE